MSAARTIVSIPNSLGAWLVSSYISVFLFSLEAIFFVRYMQTYKRDHWFLQAAVALCLVAGVITVLTSCYGIYRVAITGFGNVLQAIMPTVEMSIIPLMGAISAIVGQTYLIRRYHKVSKNWVVALILETLAVLSFGLCIWGFVALVRLAQGELDVAYLRQAPKIVYSMVAAVDILVSLALIVFLWRLRHTEIANTRKLLMRLILVAFESGAVTSMLAIATLVAFCIRPHTQLAVPFSAATGFSQSLCLLFNLNMRKVDTDGAAGSTGNVSASLYPMSKMGARTNQFGVRSGIGGVTIHQETIIASDDDRFTAHEDEEKKMPVVASIPHVYAA